MKLGRICGSVEIVPTSILWFPWGLHPRTCHLLIDFVSPNFSYQQRNMMHRQQKHLTDECKQTKELGWCWDGHSLSLSFYIISYSYIYVLQRELIAYQKEIKTPKVSQNPIFFYLPGDHSGKFFTNQRTRMNSSYDYTQVPRCQADLLLKAFYPSVHISTSLSPPEDANL